MPARNTIKTYVENGHYHIYNRGVEKRSIFQDEQDYGVFFGYLKEYLSPTKKDDQFPSRTRKNYHQRLNLLCYCLMPNHFHFLIKQTSADAMHLFMRSLCTRYSMYFNRRYQRTGRLFENTYKAILIDTDEYLLHLSRYIHLNPNKLVNDLTQAKSSYADYLRLRHTPWLNPQPILEFFTHSLFRKTSTTYQSFVENYHQDSAEVLGSLTLD